VEASLDGLAGWLLLLLLKMRCGLRFSWSVKSEQMGCRGQKMPWISRPKWLRDLAPPCRRVSEL
jgi:hypothetical protein